jgi:hypothetical protein
VVVVVEVVDTAVAVQVVAWILTGTMCVVEVLGAGVLGIELWSKWSARRRLPK